MKKLKIIAVMITMSLVCMNAMCSVAPVQAAESKELAEESSTINKDENIKSYTIEDIKALNGGKNLDIAYNDEGLVKSIDGKYTDLAITNAEDAIKSLDKVKDLFGFKDPSKEFVVNKINKNKNQTIYRLQQLHEGYMVYNSEVIINVDETGTPSFISSHYTDMKNVNLKYFIGENEAIELARANCKLYGTKYEADKIIYTDKQSDAQAAWRIKCTNKLYPTKNKILFINAESGEVISEIPLTIN